MGLEAGYVAYVHRFAEASVTIRAPKRTFHGPHEVYDPGFTARFHGFLFTTNDPDLIKDMDSSPQYGRSYKRVETKDDYDAIRKHGTEHIRMERGPAQTLAQKLGAPREVEPDDTPVSEIAPSPASDQTEPLRRRGRPRKEG